MFDSDHLQMEGFVYQPDDYIIGMWCLFRPDASWITVALRTKDAKDITLRTIVLTADGSSNSERSGGEKTDRQIVWALRNTVRATLRAGDFDGAQETLVYGSPEKFTQALQRDYDAQHLPGLGNPESN